MSRGADMLRLSPLGAAVRGDGGKPTRRGLPPDGVLGIGLARARRRFRGMMAATGRTEASGMRDIHPRDRHARGGAGAAAQGCMRAPRRYYCPARPLPLTARKRGEARTGFLPQSADKAYNRKNRSDIQKIRSDFMISYEFLPSFSHLSSSIFIFCCLPWSDFILSSVVVIVYYRAV